MPEKDAQPEKVRPEGPAQSTLVDAPRSEQPTPEEVAPAPVDNRQLWYCVDPYGPRPTRVIKENGVERTHFVCPPFHSDAHLDPHGVVKCPTCGGAGKSFMRAEVYDQAMAASTSRN